MKFPYTQIFSQFLNKNLGMHTIKINLQIILFSIEGKELLHYFQTVLLKHGGSRTARVA